MPRPLVVALVATAVAAVAAVPSPHVAAVEPDALPSAQTVHDEPAGHDEQIDTTRWISTADWRSGAANGVWTLPGSPAGVVMSRPAGLTEHTDPHTGHTTTWAYSTWTSPVTTVGFGATELIGSWNAATPRGSWIGVELRGTYTDGARTPWYTLGHWAEGDTSLKRTSVDGQGDGRSSVHTDTVAIDDPAAGPLFAGYQVRLTLYRTPGSIATPHVWGLGVMASNVPERFTVEPEPGGGEAWGVELDVPRRSQNVHAGHYPEYGGGGEVWCSPTSTAMVLEHFGVGPSRQDMAWIQPGYTDPQVAHAARMTWDYAYRGAGNWPFNTAYAASFGLDAFVTRLHSLTDLERLIAAGIPVVTSQSFTEDELTGAGYGTGGHLFVVVGFTADGDVIVNDPAADSNDTVRRVYQREQFEQVWLRTRRTLPNGDLASGSGGIAYVIHPHDVPLPAGGAGAW